MIWVSKAYLVKSYSEAAIPIFTIPNNQLHITECVFQDMQPTNREFLAKTCMFHTYMHDMLSSNPSIKEANNCPKTFHIHVERPKIISIDTAH